tara:strand:- start:2143 stop:2430 length:288 start_codon:yes stop_codon:yes gene_type:complete
MTDDHSTPLLQALREGLNREGEASIVTPAKELLVFPEAFFEPKGTSYVRFVDQEGIEVLYYDSKEWEEDPKGVMGAILGAMMGGADPFKEEKKDA